MTSKTLEDNALDLAGALDKAYLAWLFRDEPEEDEIMIASELLLKGIFGFAVPTIVHTLKLDQRGADTVARMFADALSEAVARRNPHVK